MLLLVVPLYRCLMEIPEIIILTSICFARYLKHFPDSTCRLQTNVITPTTKAADHDVPISPADIVDTGLMTQLEWDQVRSLSCPLPCRYMSLAAWTGKIWSHQGSFGGPLPPSSTQRKALPGYKAPKARRTKLPFDSLYRDSPGTGKGFTSVSEAYLIFDHFIAGQ